MKILVRTAILTVCSVFVAATISGAQTKTSANELALPADKVIPRDALILPSELAQQLSADKKPLILQVGSHVLYAQAHIPRSEYVGAAGSPAGLQALRNRVKNLPNNESLVIYCGCCPWERCPNIRAAYQLLQSLGFTEVKALYLAHNFGDDWVNKGYPVAKGR